MIELNDHTAVKEDKVYAMVSPWGIVCIFTPFRDGYKKVKFEDERKSMYFISNKEFLSAISYEISHPNCSLWELDTEDEIPKLEMTLEMKR